MPAAKNWKSPRALHGQVFDVLGDLFDGNALRDLLWEAIQYGEREDVKARLDEAIDGRVDKDYIRKIRKRKLTKDIMTDAKVDEIRLDMERAEVQRLQPFTFRVFLEAFTHLGGKIKERETGRYEITMSRLA